MVIGIYVLVLVVTGLLMWVFWVDDFDGAFIVALCILGVEILVAVIAGPAYLVSDYTCSQVAEKMGVEYDYGFFTGCFVKDSDGRWYNYNQQRIIK